MEASMTSSATRKNACSWKQSEDSTVVWTTQRRLQRHIKSTPCLGVSAALKLQCYKMTNFEIATCQLTATWYQLPHYFTWHQLPHYFTWYQLPHYFTWHQLPHYFTWYQLPHYFTWHQLPHYFTWHQLPHYFTWYQLPHYLYKTHNRILTTTIQRATPENFKTHQTYILYSVG